MKNPVEAGIQDSYNSTSANAWGTIEQAPRNTVEIAPATSVLHLGTTASEVRALRSGGIAHFRTLARRVKACTASASQGHTKSFGKPRESRPINYSWRERARCWESSTALDLSPEDKKRPVEELATGVKAFLKCKSFRDPPKAGRGYWDGFLEKIRNINKIGAPRVRVVWWRTLHDLGRLPRWPDDREHVLDLEELITIWNNKCNKEGSVDGHFMYVRFMSHRWERPHFCERCATGDCNVKAHPDDVKNVKARVMAAWGHDRYNDVLDTRPFRPEDAYFWIDFAGISQEDPWEKIAGITALPLYVASCANGMVCYVGEDGQYADRAWTALERVLGYGMTASPVLMKLDQGYLAGIPQQDRHLLASQEPDFWELRGDVLHMRLRDPYNFGKITVQSDKEHIHKIADLVAELEPVDFYGVKSKVDFEAGTSVPVEELSRVMHHVVKRRHNNMSVRYGQEMTESFSELDSTKKGCRWLCRCLWPRSADERRQEARGDGSAPSTNLFGNAVTIQNTIGTRFKPDQSDSGRITGGRKMFMTATQTEAMQSPAKDKIPAGSVGSCVVFDGSEVVVQTEVTFNQIDKNQDGVICRAELDDALKSGLVRLKDDGGQDETDSRPMTVATTVRFNLESSTNVASASSANAAACASSANTAASASSPNAAASASSANAAAASSANVSAAAVPEVPVVDENQDENHEVQARRPPTGKSGVTRKKVKRKKPPSANDAKTGPARTPTPPLALPSKHASAPTLPSPLAPATPRSVDESASSSNQVTESLVDEENDSCLLLPPSSEPSHAKNQKGPRILRCRDRKSVV